MDYAERSAEVRGPFRTLTKVQLSKVKRKSWQDQNTRGLSRSGSGHSRVQ